MMKMDFSFDIYQDPGRVINYLDKHLSFLPPDRAQYTEMLNKQKDDGFTFDRTLEELEKRTTDEYYRKVEAAQTHARRYARKVFPAYEFIMPDAVTDDWLSAMDWHKKYPTRDHSLHQTLTAYIVSTLLGNGDPSKGLMLSEEDSLLSRCAKQMLEGQKMTYLRDYLKDIDLDYEAHKNDYGYSWAVEVFYETALLAAQFHDIGYPWQFINTIANELKTASYEKVSGILLDAVKAYDYVKDRLLIYPFFGYQEQDIKGKNNEKTDKAKSLLEKGTKKTHGLPGALGFMCLNDTIRKYGMTTHDFNEATNILILDWAAVGIMMHDMPGVYWGKSTETGEPEEPILRLDFETDPLSCIISMADILEEFERPLAFFDEKEDGDTRVKVGYRFFCKGSRIEMDGGRLKFIYYYGSEEERKDNNKRRVNEVNEYLNPINGYIDLSSWGIIDVTGETKVIAE